MKKFLSRVKTTLLPVCFLLLLVTACADSPDEPIPEPTPEPEVPEEPAVEITVSAPTHITVERRQSTDVTLTFGGSGYETIEWTCQSSNSDIAEVSQKDASTVTVTGVSAGEATVSIEASATTATAKTEFTVTVEQGTVKILAIGNSFSQDAVEQYLYNLAKASSIEVVIGNMYIGGCDLDKHYSNLQSDAPAYEYRKVVAGEKKNRTGARLSDVLAEEQWDYISLQQASGKSGKYETYSTLPQIISTISAKVPDATLIWHQTWAYASSSNHESFPSYNSDQMTMYNAIVSSASRAMADNKELKIIVPSGTAIQNARTAYVGDIYNRDGYHLEVTYGRYTAACTWFESLFGIDVTGTAYKPSTVSDEMAAIARLAAHRAVVNPHQVTELTEYASPAVKDGDLTAPVYVDFGPNSISGSPWNNVTTFEPSTNRVWLKDTDGNFVKTSIEIAGGFTGSYLGVSGEDKYTSITAAGVEFPVTAWKDGLIVSGTKGTGNTPAARLTITSLNASGKYDITLMAVRFNGSHDARITSYKLIGKTESEEKQIKPGLKIASSGSGVYPSFDKVPFEEFAVTYHAVEPAADGTITIEVTGIDTGTAADGLLNALVIRKS
ncbi:MAG: DUF4886 domain-containing protein [Bacteroidales bacterium]|nr:DUF4886 domain-containing protein [Bacteroidales bacterium]